MRHIPQGAPEGEHAYPSEHFQPKYNSIIQRVKHVSSKDIHADNYTK